MYRKDKSEQMDTDHRIRHCSLHRVQLYVFTGSIPRVGRGSHRVLQGILQVPVPGCLYSGSGGHTFLHPQFSGILTISGHEPEMPYKSCNTLRNGAVHHGRPFLFPTFYEPGRGGNRNKRKRDGQYRLGIPGTTGQSWQMLLFGRQGRASRFREKSSSPRCGIFPENLALPEAFAAGPL